MKLFERNYPKYHITKKSHWRKLDEEEKLILNTEKLIPSKYKGEIFLLKELWLLHLIQRMEVSFLLEPTFYQDTNNEEFHQLTDYYENIDKFYDESALVKIYHRYSSEELYELVIHPIEAITYTKSLKRHSVLPIGYVSWQITNFLIALLKNEYAHEDIGDILSEQQLTSFKVYNENIFVPNLST